jgi:hypothetical protein
MQSSAENVLGWLSHHHDLANLSHDAQVSPQEAEEMEMSFLDRHRLSELTYSM